MGASRSGEITGAGEASRSLAGHLQLRLGTGLLLLLAGMSTAAGWALRADGAVVEAAFAWRVAFVATVSMVVLNAPILVPMWRGRVHFRATVQRSVPFAPVEFSGGGALNPVRGRSGVTGQAALGGVGLIVVGTLLWLGGLGFAPLDTSGTVSLRAGQRTSDVRPVGLRTGNLSYGHDLPHEHTFLGLARDGSGAAVLRALDPRTGESGEYALAPGEPVLLGPHRVSLVSTSEGLPLTGLRLRVQGDDVDQELTLRAGAPVPVGTTTFELVEVTEHYLESPLSAARVRLTSPEGQRELWLMPDDPGIDAAVGEADPWVLTPLALVGTDRVTVRFTRRWVWWWRLSVLGLLGLGTFLLLLVPHRTWVWTGRPGDLELRAWSLNASGNLHAWSDSALLDALGERAFEELLSVERELAASAGQGGT